MSTNLTEQSWPEGLPPLGGSARALRRGGR